MCGDVVPACGMCPSINVIIVIMNIVVVMNIDVNMYVE